MKLISQGAEAKIYLDKEKITKKRFEKKYRIPEIDLKLRRFRTRRESKVIEKLNSLGFGPKLILSDDRKMNISMDKIPGKKVREILDKKPELAIEIGKNLAIMHDSGIIHGDLTTSNMIFDKKVYFIDFGLSFFSDKTEDKAVDIHLFKQAIESAHYKIEKKAYEFFLKGYKESKYFDETLKRLELVEKRGRYKMKKH
jgi:Kae1-associated kinase Bud32